MKFFLLCLLVIPFFALSQEKKGNLIIHGTIASGQIITIIYNGSLKKEDHVYMNLAFINTVIKKDSQKYIRLKKSSDGWTDTIQIPGNANMLGITFSNGNGEGDSINYLFKLHKDAGKFIQREQDYDYYIERYTFYHQRKHADSLRLIEHQKYPDGNWLKKTYYSKITESNTLVQMEHALKSLLKRFPKIFNNSLFPRNLTYEIISKQAVEERNWGKYNFYSKRMSPDGRSRLDLQVIQRLSNINKGTHFAEGLAINLLNQYAKNDTIHYSPAGTKLARLEQINPLEFNYVTMQLVYAKLAYGNGHYQQALPYAKHVAINLLEKTDTAAYELYLQIYSHTADPVTAMSALEQYYRTSIVNSDEFKRNLRRLYLQINNTANGFDKYYADIDVKQTDKLREPILKTKIAEIPPDFSLLNLEGKRISLSSLKGKVVVLDFWATWCYYCKQAFPAMKQVMEKYAADTSVVFLYIDTQENPTAYESRKKQIIPYLTANKFDFNVLFDEPSDNHKAGDYRYYNTFKIQGLPTKYIVGADGKIAFLEVGFNGSDDELIRKLSLMIEASR